MGSRTPRLQATWVRVVDRSGRVRLEERWVTPEQATPAHGRLSAKQAA